MNKPIPFAPATVIPDSELSQREQLRKQGARRIEIGAAVAKGTAAHAGCGGKVLLDSSCFKCGAKLRDVKEVA